MKRKQPNGIVHVNSNNSRSKIESFHDGGTVEEYVLVAKMVMESQKPYQCVCLDGIIQDGLHMCAVLLLLTLIGYN